ncbi:hypothetical protein [Amaricoccus sp.]|uniref:hypothetical protein n=1 Tax=Amaricoccus sp. TaxID=1872485 RepID=UPI001B5DA631|nr:hypothetical protein [Amaricoccus sp.]MBP7001231.1 hypothetical protein [Amaricoccus sp.]
MGQLAEACEREIASRPPGKMSTGDAVKHADWAEKTRSMTLQSAIEYAFAKLPPRYYESSVIRAIFHHPGIAYSELVREHGSEDAALVLGHCVYDRYGYFRHWTDGLARMSDVLFARDDSEGRVRYCLTKEATEAFSALRMI